MDTDPEWDEWIARVFGHILGENAADTPDSSTRDWQFRLETLEKLDGSFAWIRQF